MLRQNDALPQFTGMEPVSLLIEMGIEKLKRDYLYIFSGKFNSPKFQEIYLNTLHLNCRQQLGGRTCDLHVFTARWHSI